MSRNFYNASVLTKRLPFATGCGLFSATATFLTIDVDITGLPQNWARRFGGLENKHYRRQAWPDAAGYSIDYQYSKPISFVTEDEVDLGVDRLFWGADWALNTVGFSGEEEVTDSFYLAEWVWEGWLVSRVLGVDSGEILRASSRFSAVSFNNAPPRARGSGHLSRAGGVSFYGEHP